MTRAFVTGATGFIGGHLVRALVDRGDDVVCAVRPTSNTSALDPLGVRYAVADVNDPDSLRAPCADADVVYHLAAMLRQPWHADFLTTNADGARNVATACAAAPNPPVMIAVSSLAAAGPARDGMPVDETVTPRPVSRYGESKLRGERAVAELAADVPVTVVRPPMVLGEGDRMALPMFRTAARGFQVVPIRGPLSLVYVGDLAQLLIAAADRGERMLPPNGATNGKGIYFGAFADHPTLQDMGDLIGASLGRSRVRAIRPPALLLKALGAIGEEVGKRLDRATMFNRDKIREAMAAPWLCTADKARQQLGFETPETIATRLAQTAEWYRDQGWL